MNLLDLRSLGTFVEDLVMGDTIQISRPAGPPVLNPATGDLEDPAPDIVYEGPGAILDSSAAPGITVPVAGQPYQDNPKTTYRLLTPTDAPVAARDDTVRVLRAAQDPALLGRTWRCTQPGLAATVIAVRVTWLDENNPREGTP
ncbi:DUF6093 family protein [Streptomyces javensis]|uniref:Uncharacterized protein n=1 Tax=Streptomyces javensis TaxID=114698 RepID=A0ABS0R6S9_9ACTN|nr:DUF6093 family protein [Streptomyces javensis]MBI0313018.1 hypothetical protein [Streptomyces javensis]